MPRPLSDRGKGSYWTVNEDVDPRSGVTRDRSKTKDTNSKTRSGKAKHDSPISDGGEHVMCDDPNFHPGSSADHLADQDLMGDPAGGPHGLPPPFAFPLVVIPGAFVVLRLTSTSTFPDPNLMMSRSPPLFPGEPQPEIDAQTGQPNWRSLWLKELGHLQQLTQEQEKAGVDQEWYRIMIWRVRAALLPPINPDGSVMGMMLPASHNPAEDDSGVGDGLLTPVDGVLQHHHVM